MDSADSPLLEVRDVSKTFPGVRALRGVSLELHAGEVLAVGLDVPAAPADGAHEASEKVSGGTVRVSVRRA